MNDEIQIADATDPAESPYRNLWVPLVIVPAGIVIAIVIVFALFGAISGDEASLSENLSRVLEGGRNDRSQALFNLARQATENHKAVAEGKAPPWPVEDDFLARVKVAAADVEAGDAEMRLTFGVLLASFGDEQGVEILLSLLDLDDSEDPKGKLRFSAILNLGLLGSERATASVLPYLEHEDDGLRTIATIALQSLPGEGVRPALVAALSDSALDVRGNAAISLSKLDPPEPEAAEVLRELLETGTYSAENERDAKKYRRGAIVSESRIRAVQALHRLGLPEDRALFESLREDDDIAVREAVLRALAEENPE